MDLTRPGHALVLVCVTFLTACGSHDTGAPTAPDVHSAYLVELTPAADAGAALLRMSTVGVRTLEAVDGQVYFRRVGDDLHIMLLRATAGALSFRIRFTTDEPAPDIEVLQVAGTDNRLRDVAAYHAAITGE